MSVAVALALALAALAPGQEPAGYFYSAGGPVPLAAAGPAPLFFPNAARGRLIVRLRPSAPLERLVAHWAARHVQVDEVVTQQPPRLVLRVGSGSSRSAVEVANALYESGLAVYAVPELSLPMELRSRPLPDDPLFARQWHLENTGQGGRVRDADVDAREAWRYTRGSPDIVIAVLDDGVQPDHPDLEANLSAAGRDFTRLPPAEGAEPRASADRHGTSVAGVAAARGDNGTGVTGICPRCTILPIRVHGSSNLGTAAAFRYAVEQGADVITNSWGYARGLPIVADDAVRDAIGEAGRRGRDGRGALIVFGMTNDVVDNCHGPTLDVSSLESVVAVGGSDHNDRIGGSGFGDCMDFVAPTKPLRRGTIGITTTDRTGLDGHTAGDYHTTFGGTSAAAPLVAGIAGLLLSLNPELTRTELRHILRFTAEKIDPEAAAYDAVGYSARAGYGRVNAARALVPSVRIALAPERVVAGEPFSVTVEASAPFGLEAVSWSGIDTGIESLDERRSAGAHGEAVYAATWSDLVVDRPGTYAIGADARDARHASPVEDYPHRASQTGRRPAVTLTVREPEPPESAFSHGLR